MTTLAKTWHRTAIPPADVPDWQARETTLGAMRRCVSDGVALAIDNLKARGARGHVDRIGYYRDVILAECDADIAAGREPAVRAPAVLRPVVQRKMAQRRPGRHPARER